MNISASFLQSWMCRLQPTCHPSRVVRSSVAQLASFRATRSHYMTKPASYEEPLNAIWHQVLVRWTAKSMSICLGAPCQKARPSTLRVNMTAEHLNRSLEGIPVANQHERLANLRSFLQNNVNAFLLKLALQRTNEGLQCHF